MSHQVIIAKVPTAKVDQVTADAKEEGGTVVSSHDNGDGTVTLTLSFPDDPKKAQPTVPKTLAKLVKTKSQVSFTSL